ncbi:MAG: hypothetical protein M0Z94_19710, partial [Dehalococcoidales bacterium]|nr:hypothetical protein [Dehalococcoidales bacterium]
LTSRNPVFLASNALNDAGTYLVRESSRMGGPQNLPKVVSELVRAYGDAFRGVLSGEFKGNTAEFLKAGGGQFGFFEGTPGQTRATVQELARRNAFDIGSRADLLSLVKGLATLKPVEALGERIELAPRVAAYQLAKGRGENAVQATIRGRTVTMDFAQGGQVAKIVNQFVPFFNVGVQAMAQPVRAFRENPRGFVATGIGLLAAPTVAAEAWNRSDPQRAKDYADVPDYVKDQGVVIMLPGQVPTDAQGNRRPQFVLLKLREYAPFAVMARQAAERAVGDDTRAWGNLLLGAASGVSPIQGSNTADSLLSFLPPGINTGAQLALNKDTFRDSMIATKRHDEQATAASQAIAGVTGVRPSQVEFTLRDLTGGPGAGALAASDLATGNQKDTGLSGVPLVGGFAGRLIKGSIGQGLDEAQAGTLAPDLASNLKAAGVAASVNPVGSTINGIPLTMAEETTYQQLTNQFLDQNLRRVMASPSWAGYSATNRQKVFANLLDAARARASQMVLQGVGSEEARRRKAQGAR